MPELLESAGIFRAHRDAICSLVDQIGVWLAKNAGVAGSGVWAVRSTNLSEFSSMIARVFVDTFESCSRGPSGFVEQHVAARGIPGRSGEPAANFASQNFQLFVEKQGETRQNTAAEKDAAEKGYGLINTCNTLIKV
jgi:hypothetical protein